MENASENFQILEWVYAKSKPLICYCLRLVVGRRFVFRYGEQDKLQPSKNFGTPLRSALILMLTSLFFGGCLSSSQFSGTYKNETFNETISDEFVDIETSIYEVVSYDFFGKKIDGYRAVTTMRSKVDFPTYVSAKLDNPSSRCYLSVSHDVEHCLEPGQSCEVLNVFYKPSCANKKIDYQWSARKLPRNFQWGF